MRPMLKSELLDAMRGSLRDLENLRLFSPSDLDILTQKRELKKKIAELEGVQDCDPSERAA